MDGPLFSVIVPTFGRAAMLHEAVDSVLVQTLRDLEVIVVDDASPNPPPRVADERVRWMRRDGNGGTAAARNTGLRAARGRYVTFLDDDDLFTPDRLEMVVDALERVPVAICWSRFLHRPTAGHRVLNGDVRASILWSLVPHVGATTVRRDLAPAFDESLRSGEDVEWWLRLAHRGAVTTVRRVGYLHRVHDGPRPGKEMHVRASSHRRILERHAEYFDRNSRAAAFRWKRVGRLEAAAGDRKGARRAFRRSLMLAPSPRTLSHLVRSFGPRGTR